MKAGAASRWTARARSGRRGRVAGMGEGFEHVVLTGGMVQVTGQGASLQEAFAQAALGVFALTGQRADSDHEMREVRAHGQSPGDLLLNWIAECLYVHEL